MKAAVVHEWGQQPRYLDFPEPQPGDGAVVATVEASALTNLSRMVIMGKHYSSKEIQLPAIAGVDGVARLDDGTRVYTGALAPYGLMAERTLVSPSGAVPVPEHVDSVTAAAVPNPGMSAWMSLDYAAQTKPGDHVLVLGATGVTGSLAVQLAKFVFGAGRVVVAGRNPGAARVAAHRRSRRRHPARDRRSHGKRCGPTCCAAVRRRHRLLVGHIRAADAGRPGRRASVDPFPRHTVHPGRVDDRGEHRHRRGDIAQYGNHASGRRDRQRATRGLAASPHRRPTSAVRDARGRRTTAHHRRPPARRHRKRLGSKGTLRNQGRHHALILAQVAHFPLAELSTELKARCPQLLGAGCRKLGVA
jgi:hypothetical protein